MITNLNLQQLIASEVAPRIDRFVKQADRDANGHLTTSELSQFLTEVLRKLEQAADSAPSASAAGTTNDK